MRLIITFTLLFLSMTLTTFAQDTDPQNLPETRLLYYVDIGNDEIRSVNLDDGSNDTLVVAGERWVAIDTIEGTLFFVGLDGNTITRTDLLGQNPQAVISLSGIRVLAVDEVNGKLYVANRAFSASRLSRVDFDGGNFEQIYLTSGDNEADVHDMQVDLSANALFFVEADRFVKQGNSERLSRVQRIDLTDPTNVETVFEAEGEFRGLALDTANTRIYISVRRFVGFTASHRIQRMDYDGNNLTELLSAPDDDLLGPGDIDLQLLDPTSEIGFIYWHETVSGNGEIRRSNIDPTFAGIQTFFSTSNDIASLALFDAPILTVSTEAGEAIPTTVSSSLDLLANTSTLEGLSCRIIFSLSTIANADITIRFELGGSATPGEDYIAPFSNETVIKQGSDSIVLALAIIDDDLAEPPESITVQILGTDPAVVLQVDASACIISESDGGSTFELPDVSITANEGTQFSTDIMIPEQTEQVTVEVVADDGTAVKGEDYEFEDATLTFEPGETEQTVTGTIIDDDIGETSETFNLRLQNPTGPVELPDEPEVPVTIPENDGGVPSLSISDDTVTEGETATLNVTLSEPSEQTVTVNFILFPGGDDQDPVEPGEFEPGVGIGPEGGAIQVLLTFAPGVTSQPLNFVPLDDDIIEDTETATGFLSNPTNATIAKDSGLLTILDNDSAVGLKVSISDARRIEGDTNIIFDLMFSGNIEAGITVEAQSDPGTATPGSFDYLPEVIVVGQTVQVTIRDDGLIEGNETLTVTLTNVTARGEPVQIVRGTGQGTIVDDDTQFITLENAITHESKQDGKAQVTVNAIGVSDSDTIVTIEIVGGTATNGQDYDSPTTIMVTIEAGSRDATFDIPLLDDSIAGEGGETVEFRIVNIEGERAVVAESEETGTLTIFDNEPLVPAESEDERNQRVLNEGFLQNETEALFNSPDAPDSTAATDPVTQTLNTLLTRQPTADVTVTVSTEAIGSDAIVCDVSVTTLTFTDQNFNQPQGVDVTLAGEHEDICTVTFTANGGGYNALTNSTNYVFVDPFASFFPTDVRATAFDVTPNVVRNRFVDVTYTVESVDAQSVPFAVNIAYSTNATCGDSDDVVIGVDFVPFLEADASYSNTLEGVALPLATINSDVQAANPQLGQAGTASQHVGHLCLLVDVTDRVSEGDTGEANNADLSNEISYFRYDWDDDGRVTPLDAIFQLNRLEDAAFDVDGDDDNDTDDVLSTLQQLGYVTPAE